MCEPPAKVQVCRIAAESSHFKSLSAIKQYPTMIFRWFLGATPQALNLAGAYGLHLLVESNNMALAAEAMKIMDITYENVENPELAIVFVHYLVSKEIPDTDTAMSIVERFMNPCRIRKRVVDLILQSLIRTENWVYACQVVQRYILNGPFNATIEDIQPFIFYCKNPYILNILLPQFVGQTLYLDEGNMNLVPAPISLQRFNLADEAMINDMYQRLPMKPGQALPTEVEQQINLKGFKDSNLHYVIDGANVLFSSHDGLKKLHHIVENLHDLNHKGSIEITIVLHKRHFQKNGKAASLKQQRFKKDIKMNIVETPYGVNDDYYSIFIAMKNNCLLVTNDKFRDHIYHISQRIQLWHKQTVISFNDDGTLNMPTPYTHCIQQINDTNIWFPSTNPSLGIIL